MAETGKCLIMEAVDKVKNVHSFKRTHPDGSTDQYIAGIGKSLIIDVNGSTRQYMADTGKCLIIEAVDKVKNVHSFKRTHPDGSTDQYIAGIGKSLIIDVNGEVTETQIHNHKTEVIKSGVYSSPSSGSVDLVAKYVGGEWGTVLPIR